MTDAELIARLRGDMPEMRPNRGWGWREDIDLVAVKAERKEAADRLEALVKENIALKEHVADMLAEQECGCGYDKPTDVCLGHLPLHRKTVARAERLEVRCKALIAAYDKANWMRTADYHGDECDCLRCHVDYLRATLKGDDHE